MIFVKPYISNQKTLIAGDDRPSLQDSSSNRWFEDNLMKFDVKTRQVCGLGWFGQSNAGQTASDWSLSIL